MPANNTSAQLQESSTEPNIKQVVLGNLVFDTWFRSLYPEDIVGKEAERLYVCRWCFRYSCDCSAYIKHTRVCGYKKTPPGTKVYDNEGYSVWEVDGEVYKLLAQNLSLFAKLFLDHKSVFFDVSSFLYYLLIFTDPKAPGEYHILGYFSKEKLSWDQNNLACILIFPPYQHKQLGKLLMGISYKLSAWEWDTGVIGGPEKPLSEMGRKSYVGFWAERIARFFLLGPPGRVIHENVSDKPGSLKRVRKPTTSEQMTIREIGQSTGMLVEDVVTALKEMGIVENLNDKREKVAPSEPDTEIEEAIVRKENVLEWTKIHGVVLQDPVKDEGFLGKWVYREDEEDV